MDGSNPEKPRGRLLSRRKNVAGVVLAGVAALAAAKGIGSVTSNTDTSGSFHQPPTSSELAQMPSSTPNISEKSPIPSPSENQQSEQAIIKAIDRTANQETGELSFGEKVSGIVVQLDRNDGSWQGQLLSSGGEVITADDKKYFVFYPQINLENVLRGRGLTQEQIANLNLSYQYDREGPGFENFNLPAGTTFLEKPISSIIDTTKLALPTINP